MSNLKYDAFRGRCIIDETFICDFFYIKNHMNNITPL